MTTTCLKLSRRWIWVYYLFLVTLLTLSVYSGYEFLQPTPSSKLPSKVKDSNGDISYYHLEVTTNVRS